MSQFEDFKAFSTKEFSFTAVEFKIYKNHKIENISFSEISKIEIKNGSDLKRPEAAFVFGSVLVILCVWILSDYKFDSGEFFGGPVILRILGVLFFVGGVGCYAIYSALPIHPIIEVHHKDWIERLSISALIRVSKLELFSEFLRSEFPDRFKRSL